MILGLVNLGYTFQSNRKAKEKSIIDDFWFRTVIIPKALDPLEKFIDELKVSYPDPFKLSDINLTDITVKVDGFKSNFDILSVFSEDLVSEINDEFDKMIWTIALKIHSNNKETQSELTSIYTPKTYPSNINPFQASLHATLSKLMDFHIRYQY